MTLTRTGLAVVLVLGPLLAPRAADTQDPGKVARIGVLGPSSRSDSMFRFARPMDLQLQLLEARGPDELDRALAAMARERAGGPLRPAGPDLPVAPSTAP
jgi:hypothetical protein